VGSSTYSLLRTVRYLRYVLLDNVDLVDHTVLQYGYGRRLSPPEEDAKTLSYSACVPADDAAMQIVSAKRSFSIRAALLS
jgi:hypothetical protein